MTGRDTIHRCEYDYDDRGLLRCRERPDHMIALKAMPWWKDTLLALFERGELVGEVLAEAKRLAALGRRSI